LVNRLNNLSGLSAEANAEEDLGRQMEHI